MHHWSILAAVVLASPLPAQTAESVKKAAETISRQDVIRHIGVIAHDSMMGRDTPSRGLAMTAQYVADQFKHFGLTPGGDKGTWFQRYPVPDDTILVPNTVGVLEGSDPKLKHEYIVLTAHMDHIGIASGSGEADSIYNGASDNASGTAGIIELAEAFAQAGVRPRRSLIFLAVSGEEKGLWGSRYFVEHPSVPLSQIVANVNLDGLGRADGDTVHTHGEPGSYLTTVADRIHAAHAELQVVLLQRPASPSSDHVNFQEHGIPFLSFEGAPNSEFNPDNHRVTDSAEKINADTEARLLRLVFHFTRDLANADERPR